ncbi:MAG: AMP-dependent synthetase and ligase [Acidobacteriales bacterium]|nr:AMP-dependent synthetase and ligase [Terriglobales bacterium]
MQSFYSRFQASVDNFPSHIAVELQLASPSTEVIAHTYTELRTMAESVGNWIRHSNIPPGARCSIIAANTPRWVAAYLGIMASGAVAVPLDTAFTSKQISKLLLDSGSTLIFTDEKQLADVKDAVAETGRDIRIALLSACPTYAESEGRSLRGAPIHTLDEMFAAGSTGFIPAQTHPHDLAVILYTSGTTSDPKGVMLTHANLDAEANSVFSFIRIDDTDAILGVLPLFHALAQMANLLLPYSAGTRVVYMEQLNTTELLRALRDRKITLFCCVPQFFYLIHERVMKQVKERSGSQQFAFRMMMRTAALGRSVGVNLGKIFFGQVHRMLGTHIRYLITGGSRFEPQIGRDLETLGFDILQAYGLTECCGGATVTGLRDRFTGSVGRALLGVELKILQAAQTDSTEDADSGEVAIKGGIVMKGYYNRPDATASVIKDGWLLTGDLGRLDNTGNLFITGRQKDVIVLSNGKNVYPEELEAHYLRSPWIKEIAVMGIQSRPGEPISERIHAVVVPNMDVIREKKIVNMKEVIRFDIENLSTELPSTKRVLSYDIWQSDLPRTTTRKLKRYQISKMVEEKQNGAPCTQSLHGDSRGAETETKELTAEESAWMASPDVALALETIRAAAKRKGNHLHPSDNLELDLGLDSMERVELVVALEQTLGAKADEALINDVYTVRELIEAVRAGIGDGGARAKSGWAEVFATETTDPEVLAIVEDRPIATHLWYALQRIARPLTRLLFRMKITGLEKLPQSGPFILSPNHQSFLDGPIVTAHLPYRIFKDLFYVGTSEVFGSGLMRRLARSLKLIPVDPDANLVPAMRAGSFGLKRGKILVLYPEGERSIDGELKTFKKGAAILAAYHNVPIVPVALEGFHNAWPRSKNFQGFHHLQIAIGDPIYPPANAASPEAAHEQITRELRDSIFKLWTPLHANNSPVLTRKSTNA